MIILEERFDMLLRSDISEEERIELKKMVFWRYYNKKKKKNYPYEFQKKSKNLLKDARSGRWCKDCWCIKKLTVHHLDIDIYNNIDDNLVVLCWECHSKYHSHMIWNKPPVWLN